MKNTDKERFIDGGDTANDMIDHGRVVYVVAPNEDGPCKIGITGNIKKRLEGIQCGCWLPLAVYASRICFRRDSSMPGGLFRSMGVGAQRVETETHRNLKKCDVHLRGEWFDVTVGEAVAAIVKSAEGIDAAAISLEQIISVELPDHSSDIEKRTHQSLTASMLRVNAFAKETIDNIPELV